MCAVEMGRLEIVKYLIAHGADKNIRNKKGKIALDIAIDNYTVLKDFVYKDIIALLQE